MNYLYGFYLFLSILFINGCASSSSMVAFDGPFSLCADKNNCVSTEDPRDPYHIDRFKLRVELTKAWPAAKNILVDLPRSTIISEQGYYIHVQVKSLIFRFVDNVEVKLNESDKTISIKSASVTGTYDFGVNGNRVSEIYIKLFEAGVVE